MSFLYDRLVQYIRSLISSGSDNTEYIFCISVIFHKPSGKTLCYLGTLLSARTKSDFNVSCHVEGFGCLAAHSPCQIYFCHLQQEGYVFSVTDISQDISQMCLVRGLG